MTIKDLKKYLEENYPHIFRKTSIYTFHKCKIAIDASGLAHNYWHPMQKTVIAKLTDPAEDLDIDQIVKLWLKNIWSLISKFLRMGITPIIVLDGAPPVEKSDVIKQRQDEKVAAKTAIDEFKDQMKSLDPLLRTSNHLTHIKKLYYGWKALTFEHMVKLKMFFMGLGLPVLQAKNEAEELCAELCRKGLVSAVYCEDSDSLAHLAPCWIYSKTTTKELIPERKEYIESFEYVLLEDVLDALGMTKETFVDFCIMCGCDYNKRIPQKGPSRSYELLTKYTSIDNLPNLDISNLKHHDCRRLFANRDYSEICTKPDYTLEVDRGCIETYSKEYLSKCEMEYLVTELDFIYAAFPIESIKIDYKKLKPEKVEVNLGILDFQKINIGQLSIDFNKLNI